jgi:hypothetical protein
MRLFLAALLGGLVVFLWSSFTHVVTPLGQAGIQSLPNEETILPVLQNSIPGRGFYFFPAMSQGQMTAEDEAAWTERYRTGPTGILVYRPIGGEPIAPSKLLIEFLTNVMAALVAALVISSIPGGLLARALSVSLLGVFAWLSISASYWNWYEFPGTFIAAEGLDQFVGWFLGGLVMAWVLKRRQAGMV